MAQEPYPGGQRVIDDSLINPTHISDESELLRESFWNGPTVKFITQAESKEIVVPQALLVAQSTDFESLLKDAGDGEIIILDEDVNTTSFIQVIDWICFGQVTFDSADPHREILALMEFSKLTRKFGISGIEEPVGNRVVEILLSNPALLELYRSQTQYSADNILFWLP